MREGETLQQRPHTLTPNGLRVNVVLPSSFSTVTVVIDGYTHNSIITSGDSVPLGNQIILVCRVVGLPYGTPLNYTWTCPNEPCEVEGYYGRKVYNEHILAVNTMSTRDEEAYTCQVTAKEDRELMRTSHSMSLVCVYVLYCTAAVTVLALHLSFTHIQVAVLCTAMEDSYLISFP